MLPRVDSVAPVGRVDAPASVEGVADARQEAFQRSLAGSLGKSLQGDILSRLTDGSFLVKVGGTSARMLLPQGAQVGQQVALTLVTLTPRPTFQVATQQAGHSAVAYAEAGPAQLPGTPGAAARAAPLVYLDGGKVAAPDLPDTPAPAAPPAASAAGAAAADAAGDAMPAANVPARPMSYAASLLSKAPLTAAEHLPELNARTAPAALSEAARTIATVLSAAASGGKTPTAIVAPAPLLPSPAAATDQLASALHQSLGESGVFYESHVAEWSSGQRPLASLAREPQMQRSGAEQQPAAPVQDSRAGALPGIDRETAQFINFQLHTHEQGRVAWEGQPWPGQAMRWEVSKDAPDQRPPQGEEQAETPWRSGVRMTFPLLGDINATVVIHGGQLHIQVEAGSNQTGSLLREHAGRLSDAMDAAGLPLSSLNIRASAGSHE